VIKIEHIDTACTLIQLGDLTILTDPCFDSAGNWYYFGYGTLSKKTNQPARSIKQLPKIDLILLSHHQHSDNLDHTGKQLVAGNIPVISTKKAAAKIKSGTGLSNWQTTSLFDDRLKVTAILAQHHPFWMPGFLSGPVIGFVLEYENKTIYITGDTVYTKKLKQVKTMFPKIDILILHLGAVQFRYLTGTALYTMNAKQGLRLSQLLNPNAIIPVHYEGWKHFKEDKQDIIERFKGTEYEKKLYFCSMDNIFSLKS